MSLPKKKNILPISEELNHDNNELTENEELEGNIEKKPIKNPSMGEVAKIELERQTKTNKYTPDNPYNGE